MFKNNYQKAEGYVLEQLSQISDELLVLHGYRTNSTPEYKLKGI